MNGPERSSSGVPPRSGPEGSSPGMPPRSGTEGSSPGMPPRSGPERSSSGVQPKSGHKESSGVSTKSGNEGLPSGVPRPRRAAWIALALLWAASLTAVRLRGGAAEWFTAAVIGGLMLFCFLAPRLSLGRLAAFRTIDASGPLSRGEEGTADVGLTLKVVRGPLALPFVWIHIREELVNESAVSRRSAVYDRLVLPWFAREWSFRYPTGRLQRGAHRFHAVTVTAGDLFGLTAVRRTLPCEGEILALPGPPPLPVQLMKGKDAPVHPRGIALPLSSGGEPGAGRKKRQPGGGTESRAYRQGDALRHIDWRSSAKGRGLRTKLREPDEPAPMLLALDTAALSYESSDRLFDDCTALALDMIRRAVSEGRGVRLLCGSAGALAVAPGDPRSVARAAERLARARMNGSETPLALTGLSAGEPLPRGGTLQVITACWREGSGWQRLAERTAASGCRLEVAVAVRGSSLSTAQLERQRRAEAAGIKVRWIRLPDDAPASEARSGEWRRPLCDG